jgi:hypothetical protein
MSTRENITKASQTTELLCDDLQAALRTADPVVAILLLKMIGQAAMLHVDLRALAAAVEPQ